MICFDCKSGAVPPVIYVRSEMFVPGLLAPTVGVPYPLTKRSKKLSASRRRGEGGGV